jgi:GntR family transcriptional regulator
MPSALLSPPVWKAKMPLHKQLKEEMLRHVAKGIWKRGDALPTEPALAEYYGVSISTVRAAIGSLVEAGLLVRRAGRGTHVAARGGKESVYRFFHLVPNGSPTPDATTGLVSEVLACTKSTATAHEASQLLLPAGKKQVIHLRNVLRLHGQAVQTAQLTLPAHLYPGLTAAKLNAANDTLYGAFQKIFGITVVRTQDRIRAASASPSVAKQLGLKAGEPVLEMQRTAYTFDNVVLEVRLMHISTAHHHFYLEQGGT